MDPGKFSRRRPPETIRFCHYLVPLWALALSSSVCAQGEAPVFGVDGVASLDTFIETTRTLRAEFRQELWNSEGRLIETAVGTLWLKRPNMFLWNYREPFEQLIVGDGENLWIYDMELGQVTVNPLDDSIAATPAMLLSGDEAVRDGFDVMESFTAEGIEWVRLAPRLEGTDFSNVLIGFRAGLLDSLELLDGLDQVTEIEFREVEVNPEISNDSFQFSPPENVDVIGQPAVATR